MSYCPHGFGRCPKCDGQWRETQALMQRASTALAAMASLVEACNQIPTPTLRAIAEQWPSTGELVDLLVGGRARRDYFCPQCSKRFPLGEPCAHVEITADGLARVRELLKDAPS